METETAEKDWLNVRELAELFRISVPTVYRILKDGPARERKTNSVDLRQIPDRWIGGRRYWNRQVAQSLFSGDSQ